MYFVWIFLHLEKLGLFFYFVHKSVRVYENFLIFIHSLRCQHHMHYIIVNMLNLNFNTLKTFEL